LEYEEKFLEFWGREVAENLLATLLTAPNTSLHSIYYNFFLVSGNADDNKFADIYLTAGADILVSNDSFLLRRLRSSKFPVVNGITLQEFATLLSAPAF
jgi:predicted nucleic acid-binding protein